MATNSIYASLLAAQKEMGPLLKNATNPHFRNKYADLSAVIETISEPLNNNGLVFFQSISHDEAGATILNTVIADTKSGETLVSAFPIVCKDPQNPQAIGGAITYLRRYSLMAMLGLAPEDDDGHAASQKPQKVETKDLTRRMVEKPEPQPERDILPPPADPVTGEIETASEPFDEEKEKTALMRHIFAAARDLDITDENLKHEMWALFGGKTKEAEFSRKDMTIDQLTQYRDRLVAKAKTVKGAVK